MTQVTRELIELAERCEARDRKLRKILTDSTLSVTGRAVAVSIIVTLDLDIFRDCAAALRARSAATL